LEKLKAHRWGPRDGRPAHRREAALAGLLGTGSATLLAGIAHTVAPVVAFPPIAISQILVRTPPGSFDSFFIDRLGHWAMRLAVIGTSIGFVASGAILGQLVPALRRRIPAVIAGLLALVPLWLASIALYQQMPRSLSRWPYAAAILPAFVVGGAVGGLGHRRLTAPAPVSATNLSRRYFLRGVWRGGLGLALGASNIGRLVARTKDPGDQLLHVPRLTLAERLAQTEADAAFARIPGLTPEVTSIARHFVVDEEIIDPEIDPLTWRMIVKGMVGRPFQLTYGQLKALPAVERYQTLECISNEVGGDLISTAKWVGVPLPEILGRAGVGRGAVEVVFRAAGGYSDSLSIDQAMDPSTLIAIGMNGHVLPRAHGFPARLLSVGNYGMKNPKWLTEIEVVNHQYEGFWEGRGWTKPAIVKTWSRIDTPPSGTAVGRSATVAGIAYAGDRGISRVEVSTDGSRTWNQAELKTPLSGLTWRLWRYTWDLTARGEFGAVVRAYDGRGGVQLSQFTDPYPSGATGYDAIEVSH
jgi:DMSO/TMAO reductase YedYZ molybdopterin-dependent catalytic subunit